MNHQLSQARATSMLAVAIVALSVWQIPAPAWATQCGASTPTNVTQPDDTHDTFDGNGMPVQVRYAPDFTSVNVAVNSDCTMTLSYRLDRPSGEHWLMGRETAAVFLDTDGNAATGSDGFERALTTIGSSYAADRSQLESWNGTSWEAQEILTSPGPGGAQRLTFDVLGISEPTIVFVQAVSKFTDISGPHRDQFDLAPDNGPVGVGVAFAPTPTVTPTPTTSPTPTPTPTPKRDRLKAVKVAYDYFFAYSRRTLQNRPTRFKFSELPPGAVIELRCRGKGCRFSRKSVKVTGSTANLLPLVRNTHLARSAYLEVRTSAPSYTTEVLRFVAIGPTGVKFNRLCLPSGARQPAKC